jgi:hypothetical protein
MQPKKLPLQNYIPISMRFWCKLEKRALRR